MKPSEIWSFPLDNGETGFLRAVLAIKDLELAPQSHLNFVSDAFLVQVSKSRSLEEATFEPDDMLINGIFLNKHRTVSKSGYQKVGAKTVRIEDVEFPCWFADSYNKLLFCRGEIGYELKGFDSEYIRKNWNVRLTLCFPAQLPENAIQARAYLETPEQTDKYPVMRISDLRYHPKKDDILNSIGVSISEPYYEVVRTMLGEEKLRIYEQAIIGAPKKK
jgi:hypothetical protein